MENQVQNRTHVIQALGWYFPDSSGGTEVYVRDLVVALDRLGIDSTIAAPCEGNALKTYRVDGRDVFRYPVTGDGTRGQIRGSEPHSDFDLFANWMKGSEAGIFHQHSWTMGCGLRHLKLAKQLGMKTVTTVHVPGPVCIRGTMMRGGKFQCDGKIDVRRCAQCWADAKGTSALVASALASVPISVGNAIIKSSIPSKFISAVATTALVSSHKAKFNEMVDLSDKLVVVCEWLRDAMIANGVSREKVKLCRQGVRSDLSVGIEEVSQDSKALRIGFIGRWDKTKGIGILVEAMARLPQSVNAELVIYARVQNEENELYRREILALLGSDQRVSIEESLDRSNLPRALSSIDVLAVPSQWLETGPLVVLEALALGVPVVGSNLGGIAELVRDGDNGILLPYDDVNAWIDAFTRLADDRSLLEKLKRNILPGRTMDQVATEMLEVYEEVIG